MLAWQCAQRVDQGSKWEAFVTQLVAKPNLVAVVLVTPGRNTVQLAHSLSIYLDPATGDQQLVAFVGERREAVTRSCRH